MRIIPAPIATPFQNHNPNTNMANTATSMKAVGLDIIANPNSKLDMSTYFLIVIAGYAVLYDHPYNPRISFITILPTKSLP
jgi:hypothetical protein